MGAKVWLYSQIMRPLTLFTLAFLFVSTAAAQQLSPWQGEWVPLDGSGDRLTLSECTGSSCKFYLFHTGCGTQPNSPLELLSQTAATANLPGPDAAHSCHLRMERRTNGDKPVIAVQQSGTGCAYYCIASFNSFETTFVQHSQAVYAGLHTAECLKTPGPAMLATCLDPGVAGLEQQWQELYADFPLTPLAKEASTYKTLEALDTTILAQCDHAASPAQCLHDRFTSDLALMNAKKAAFVQGYTERGDVAEAARKGAAIAGRYRHTFENGDVTGRHYRTTDRLEITQISRNSIHFDMDLNFFNGHSCGINGGALFRKDGSFVFDDDPTNASSADAVCHLAIVPTATGVTFKDLNGSCKMLYCGARGSLDAAGFLFAERVAKPTKNSPTK